MNTLLLKETISLLKEAKLEHCSNEDGMATVLAQAIQNLEEIQDDDSDSDRTLLVLLTLGKVFESFPEIKEFLKSLAEL